MYGENIMAKITPYIFYENSKKAIEFYKELFEAKLIMHYPCEPQDNYIPLPDDFDYANSTMHAVIEIYGEKIFISDDLQGKMRGGKSSISISLEPDNKIQLDTIYEKVQKMECKIIMPLKKQHWGDLFTMFIDPFGICWQINFTDK